MKSHGIHLNNLAGCKSASFKAILSTNTSESCYCSIAVSFTNVSGIDQNPLPIIDYYHLLASQKRLNLNFQIILLMKTVPVSTA